MTSPKYLFRRMLSRWFPELKSSVPANVRTQYEQLKDLSDIQKKKLTKLAAKVLNPPETIGFPLPAQNNAPKFGSFLEGKEHVFPNPKDFYNDKFGTLKAKLSKAIIPELGFLATQESDGKKYHPKLTLKHLKPGEMAGYLREADKLAEKLKLNVTYLREDVFGSPQGFNQDGLATTATGLVGVGQSLPYPPWPYTRQMYMPDQWFMISRATNAYNYSPLARAGVNLKTAFIIGNGPRISLGENVKAQQIWDEVARRIKFIERLRKWDRMITVNGEFFVESFVDKQGRPDFRSIDPGTVWEIITEPRDIEIVYGIHLLYTTQFQYTSTGARGEQVPVSEWVYEIIPPDNIKHLKLNVQENEKRGRSDLLPILSVVQWFNDYLQYAVTQEMVQAAYAWDITLKNADASDIAAISANNDVVFPKPNSTFLHNEDVTRTATQHTGRLGTQGTTFEALLTTFALGLGIAKEYMGASERGSRAAAITATEPTVKMFQERRSLWEDVIRAMVKFACKTSGIEVLDDQIEVTWPEIAPEDVSKKLANVLQLVENKLITKRRGAMMLTKDFDITNYDYETEMKDVLEEMQNDPLIQMVYPQQFKAPTGGGDAPGAPTGGSGVPSPSVLPDVGQPPEPSPVSMGGDEKAAIKQQHRAL